MKNSRKNTNHVQWQPGFCPCTPLSSSFTPQCSTRWAAGRCGTPWSDERRSNVRTTGGLTCSSSTTTWEETRWWALNCLGYHLSLQNVVNVYFYECFSRIVFHCSTIMLQLLQVKSGRHISLLCLKDAEKVLVVDKPEDLSHVWEEDLKTTSIAGSWCLLGVLLWVCNYCKVFKVAGKPMCNV